MTFVADVVAKRPGARRSMEAEYRRQRVVAEGSTLLDELAVAAAGSPEALEVLVGLVQADRLARPGIRRLIVDEADIDDVEQAVLAVVALKVGQYRREARFTTWLHRVASNEAKMFVRARSRRPVTVAGEAADRGYLARLSSLVGDRDVIERALDAIPEHYREALVLREVRQLDYGEIATCLDVPVGTVRSRLNKARQLMARQLDAVS